MPDAVVKRLDDRLLEPLPTRVRLDHGIPRGNPPPIVVQPQHISLYPRRDQGDQRVHVLWNARRGMQRDRRPHTLDIALVHAVALEEIARRIGTVHLEAAAIAAVLMGQAHVMEHAACVQQFTVVTQPQPLPGKGREVEHPAGVVEQQRGSRVTDELGDFPSHGAVGHLDTGDG